MDQGQLRVGLVGTGPWAATVHAPGLAEHPGTKLTAVWSHRAETARALADAHDATGTDDLDELFSQVDALAFAVPPAVQAKIATRAAAAGKHLILAEPMAPELADARRLAAAVEQAGVASLVMLTLRFAPRTREWLDDLARSGGWRGGGARWLSGALLGGAHAASAWRHDPGDALADVGPHAVDLLDVALGPITDVLAAHHGPDDLWQLMFEHEGGATSTATLSLRLPIRPSVVEVVVYGDHGYRTLGREPGPSGAAHTALLDDFAALVASGTTTHPCDVHRGVHLSALVERARELAG
ncbi:MAG TPA: Gfo/Idh/MocA family oxidoreductase [Amycolatopsis sp.]|nr:Gfo/Idh/MocA family oxidoreductase [Amycolatopsis sp.]